METYITERIPLEVEQAFVVLSYIMRQSSEMLDKTEDARLKISLLSLIKDIEKARIELLSDSSIAREIVRDWKARHEKLLNKEPYSHMSLRSEEQEEEDNENGNNNNLSNWNDKGRDIKQEEEEGQEEEEKAEE